MAFSLVFGGDTVSPSEVSYSALELTENTQLYWPLDAQVGVPLVARIMAVEQDQADRKLLMPDARNVSPGETVLFNNVGSYNFQVQDVEATQLINLTPGTQWLLYLASNSTAAGTWAAFQFGAAISSTNASALAGTGLKAIGSQLFWAQPVVTFDINYSAVDGDRAKTYVWTASGSGTLELPSPGDVGNNWVMAFRNAGGGSVTVSVAGGANIDGATTKAYVPTASSYFVTDGAQFYTLGFDTGSQETQFNYTLVNVAGSGDYTLTGSQLNNTVYKFTGILTGNRNIIVPTTVQQYWCTNGATGAYTLTVKTAAGTGVVLAENERAILYCDGTDVVDADTSAVASPIPINNGGTNATTAAGARTNLGLDIGTNVQAYSSVLQTLSGLTINTIGQSYLTQSNPGAITFIRQNANNSISALNAADFRTAIGAGAGTVTSVAGTGTVSGLTLSGTVTSSGNLTLSGSAVVNNANWSGTDLAVTNGGTGASTAADARTNLGLGDSASVSFTNLTLGTLAATGLASDTTVISVNSNFAVTSNYINVQGNASQTTGSLLSLETLVNPTAGTRALLKINNNDSSATGATPANLRQNAVNQVLILDQDATGSGASFIDFQGTTGTGASVPISTSTTPGAIQGFIQIEINGTKRWLPFYADPS